jgi:hypothetical protein
LSTDSKHSRSDKIIVWGVAGKAGQLTYRSSFFFLITYGWSGFSGCSPMGLQRKTNVDAGITLIGGMARAIGAILTRRLQDALTSICRSADLSYGRRFRRHLWRCGLCGITPEVCRL